MNFEIIKSIKPSHLIFLLGGYDLEMVEIRKILESSSCRLYDRNLFWGAKLSSYNDLFDNEHTFIGIELIADCTPPKHYIEMDYHNEVICSENADCMFYSHYQPHIILKKFNT